MRMSSGLEKLLPFDCLNINEFWRCTCILIKMTYIYRSYCFLVDLISMKKISHNFGGGYKFVVEFACFSSMFCLGFVMQYLVSYLVL